MNIGSTNVSDYELICAQLREAEEYGYSPSAELIAAFWAGYKGLGDNGLDLLEDWETRAEQEPTIARMLQESENVFTFEGTIPSQTGRSILETKGQEIFDAVGYANTYPNTLLGVKLATMGGNSSLRFGPGGTMVFEGIEQNSAAGKMMAFIKGNPLTVGYVILTTDQTITEGDLTHELGHVTQYAILGWHFLPIYLADSIMAGFDWNKKWMETRFLPNWPRR